MKKAEAGIGTLIIFISMILVAAVAAGVLIQTASSLQSKAIDTGHKAKAEVSTSTTALQLYLNDSNSDADILVYNHTYLKLRLSAGSQTIRL